MCGILCHVGSIPLRQYDLDIPSVVQRELESPIERGCPKGDHLFDKLVPKILARGSDYCNYIAEEGYEAFSSVLSLRPPFTRQPHTRDGARWVVQFNGELYNDVLDCGAKHLNDTCFILDHLETQDDVFKVVSHLEGEFAYCIFDRQEQKLYFGKDMLGKRALAYGLREGGIYVSSVYPSCECRTNFEECVNGRVYLWDIKTQKLTVVTNEENDVIPKPYFVQRSVRGMAPEDVVDRLDAALTTAVKKRIGTIFALHEASADFAILYSGGIDCTLLASIVAQHSAPGTKIDLLNVSFHNPRTGIQPNETPDRLLALKGWTELQKRYPDTIFNFVEEDVPYEEYLQHKARVMDLIYPNDTEMDLSIAVALYFAARGKGNRVYGDQRVPYVSDCKVLISGLGADELFGGYTRHERIFTKISQRRRKVLKEKTGEEAESPGLELYDELQRELQMELVNIYIRNLSRDDKVMSSWSKEVRFPFLDTNVIHFVCGSVPLDMKLYYDSGSGEIVRKRALRLLADKYKLDWVVNEPKRAIQFGARSAKMEKGAGRTKGTDTVI